MVVSPAAKIYPEVSVGLVLGLEAIADPRFGDQIAACAAHGLELLAELPYEDA
jgi:hypothetical protein